MAKNVWEKNIISVSQKHVAGACPRCGSNNTDYGFQIILESERMGYGAIWCNDCKRGFVISRIFIKHNEEVKPIPQGIAYD